MRFSKSRIEKTPPECSLESDRKTPKEASRTQKIKNGPDATENRKICRGAVKSAIRSGKNAPEPIQSG
jgi:hypothetical protein